jgi:Mu transposase-like protein/IstB-like ATP binding protein
MTFAHLADAIDGVLRCLGATSRAWRTDRMATVVYPGTDRITAQFCQVAKHYGVEVWVCPPRRPQRKGVVEAAVKYVTRSWWRTAPVSSLGQAPADLDRWAVAVSDLRKRRGTMIAELAAQEGCWHCRRRRSRRSSKSSGSSRAPAMVAFEGNRYSVAPGHIGQTVTVRARLGELHLEDTTVAAAILDRLLHHATVIQIDHDSYHMRGHRTRLAQLRTGLNHGGEFS